HETREFFAEERQELFCRAGHEEEDAGSDPLRSGIFRGSGEGFEFTFAIGDARNQWRGQGADGNARFAELADGREAQIGTGSARLEKASKAWAQGGDSDVNIEARAAGNFLKNVNIASD